MSLLKKECPQPVATARQYLGRPCYFLLFSLYIFSNIIMSTLPTGSLNGQKTPQAQGTLLSASQTSHHSFLLHCFVLMSTVGLPTNQDGWLRTKWVCQPFKEGPTPKCRDFLTSELLTGQALGLFVSTWEIQSEGIHSLNPLKSTNFHVCRDVFMYLQCLTQNYT